MKKYYRILKGRLSMLRTFVKQFDGFEKTLLIISLLPGILFLFLPINSLLTWFQTDDAFYYFVTAQNISAGLGSTFDGIALTNGYHPLWMLICVPVFFLAHVNPFLPLRIIILIQTVLNITAGILLYRLGRSYLPRQAAMVIAIIWLFMPSIYSTLMIGGVESTLNGLLLIAVLFSTSWSCQDLPDARERQKRFLITGILSGLAILARLDNVFFIALMGLWLLSRNSFTFSGFKVTVSKTWPEILKMLAAYSLPLLLLVGGYLLWNYTKFDSILPISGLVKHWWGVISGDPYGTPPSTLRELYYEIFTSTDKNIVPFWLPYSLGQTVVERVNQLLISVGLHPAMKTLWVVLGLGLLFLTDRSFSYQAVVGLSLIPLSLGCIAQVLYYKLSGHVATRSWYWISEMLLTVLFIGVVLGVLIRAIRNRRNGKVIAWAGSTIIIGLIMFSFVRYFRSSFLRVDQGQHPYLAVSEWLEEETEEDAVIGIAASGSTAYFTKDRTIVNLDGLINGFEYFNRLRSDEAFAYLSLIGTDYIFGPAGQLLEQQPYKDNFEGRLFPISQYSSDSYQATLWGLR
jgi:hypothetical protein